MTDYVRQSDDGRKLDTVLAVTPTWAENEVFTAMLRTELKSRGLLGKGEAISVHDPLSWTKAQKQRAENYTPGLLVTFNRIGIGFRKGHFAEVMRVTEGKVWIKGMAGERLLPLRNADFDVAQPRSLEICSGDKVLVRANDRRAGLINGQVFTVESVRDGVIHTTEDRCIDTKKFRQLAHGFAVTSHQSQGKTADHVVVAAERLDAKAAYVACSRGRFSCSVYTPDKTNLMDRLPEGKRTAALDYFLPNNTTEARNSAWGRNNGNGQKDWLTRVQRALGIPWYRDVMKEIFEWYGRIVPGRAVEQGRGPDHSR